ncbi:DUF3443 domain-containing protein [Trinickia dinghuensis]|uniref:DUF3443 domain-containing protein n=1 Tax=Trinickia dinghuensis TaxID=2291023 RepID=A0A3D8K026_9BURK|nr:DUF3443 domain-containing protein [Trinickia dinghuensis]RDU98256.1 DUF3443 domain-containing protein [Trinickia dinghuensis]
MLRLSGSKGSKVVMLAAMLLAACLTAACGGGGGGGGGGSGGGASSVSNTSQAPVVSAQPNVAPISVDHGVSGVPNMPFVSVTICAPGGTNCQTIDHVLVDTGSWGLRVFASQLPASVALPQETIGNGNALAECMQFFDGYTWGSVRTADVRIGGELASSLPIQVIDPNYAAVPASCSNTGASRNTPSALAANGILGIGVFKHDCGAACVSQAVSGTYYACTGTSCAPTAVAESSQVANPVPYFGTDGNGVIVSLPAVPSGAAASVSGSLIFGIGTQSNNGLGSAQAIGVDPTRGVFTTTQNGTTYSGSIIDSGSTGLFFSTNQMSACASPNQAYYCPSTTEQFSAVNTGSNGTTSAVTFSVGNAAQLWQSSGGAAAMPLFAGPAFVGSQVFDWGLPFFYGRNVYVAVEQQPTPAGTGPYFAY